MSADRLLQLLSVFSDFALSWKDTDLREIEPLGSGTAQGRVPAEWARKVERDGQFSKAVACGTAHWQVDLDLP